MKLVPEPVLVPAVLVLVLEQVVVPVHVFAQVPVPVSVGNLGDSRAVMGVYESGELRTVPLSTTRAESIQALRQWARDRARRA